LEVEAILDSYMDKMVSLAAQNFQSDSLTGDMVYYQLESDTEGFVQKSVTNSHEKDFDSEIISKFIQEKNATLGTVKSGGVSIISTHTTLKAPYLLIAAPVARDEGQVSHWAWAAFRM